MSSSSNANFNIYVSFVSNKSFTCLPTLNGEHKMSPVKEVLRIFRSADRTTDKIWFWG